MPVIRNVDQKGVIAIASEMASFAVSRARKASPLKLKLYHFLAPLSADRVYFFHDRKVCDSGRITRQHETGLQGLHFAPVSCCLYPCHTIIV